MRIRSIKPDFFIDEDICSRPPLERLLFQALWLQADREGRLEDKPGKIKAQALPYDECDVDQMLDNLAAARFILRYEVQGCKYIQVRTFEKHQRPNTREAQSSIPAPPNKPVRSRARTRTHVHAQAEGKGREGEREGEGVARKRTTELDRLLAEPEIRSLSELWVQGMGTQGERINLGVVRAVQKFYAAGYTYAIGADAIMGIKTAAKDSPLRDRYPERCLARWAADHNTKPGYVLRPEKVEEIAADYRRYGQLPTPSGTPTPATASRPRALERDDAPLSPEEIATIKADRERLFSGGDV